MTTMKPISLLCGVTFCDGYGVIVGRCFLPRRGAWIYDVAIGGVGGPVACFTGDQLTAGARDFQLDVATGATPRQATRAPVRLQHVRGAA